MAFGIFGVAGIFIWQAGTTSDNFYINLSTELLGALITTTIIRRDWLWGARDISDETRTEKHKRILDKRHNLEIEEIKRRCHMTISLAGKTRTEIDNKKQVLIESIEIEFEDEDTKRKEGGYERILYANCRLITIPPVAPDHLTVILDGHEEAVNKATQRFTETFDVQEPDDELTHLSIARTQRRMQVNTPVQSFEQELYDMINMLVARWQDSVETVDKPSEDFADGYQDAIQYVCKNLIASVETA